MDDDQEFDALLEQSSLRSEGARRLSERTPAGRASDVQMIIELLVEGDADSGYPGSVEEAARELSSADNAARTLAELALSIDNPAWLSRLATAAGHSDNLLGLARVEQMAGNSEGAETLYRAAVHAGDTTALLFLARMREAAGDPDGAEAFYQAAVDAGVPDASFYLAALQVRFRDREESVPGDPMASIRDVHTETDTLKIVFYRYVLERGGVSAMAIQLARHPEDVRLVMENLPGDQLKVVQNWLRITPEEVGSGQDPDRSDASPRLAANVIKEVLAGRPSGLSSGEPVSRHR